MFRYALQKYIESPEKEPAVVSYTDDYVIVKDAYPKALRHYLVMPRSEEVTHTHPLEALRSSRFVDSMQDAVKHARRLVVEDLIEAGFLERAGQKHFEESFIRAGVHSVPSMNNLHIHVITQDFFSPSMKNKKHYNSFTTPFFVEFPDRVVHEGGEDSHTASDSSMESGSSQEHLAISGGKLMLGRRRSNRGKNDPIRDNPLRCTYCQRSYGSKFSMLKAHLAQEFAEKFGSHDPPHHLYAASSDARSLNSP